MIFLRELKIVISDPIIMAILMKKANTDDSLLEIVHKGFLLTSKNAVAY
ncbi:Uncharacterised protein [Providencia rustigianii]|uniref:Uncharacterized protein n=2 Tax=Providencia rustigianii TaxID=158850 RepID=D1P267_9GAMM|nr:hypothetical protein PROVRUST_06290 [Providencia rustigianii DSM 4541]SUC28592.1 Uncharacterised protein [Providencia rustigianii]SUC36888.1 Uncharacterised protein [Providencia rustigianii]VEB75309.1 Uncharacterised protein [Providencia rustigianii]